MPEVNKPDQGNSTNQAPDTNAEGTVQPTLEELQKEFLIIKQNAENDRLEKERIQRELETKKKELSTRDSKITEFQEMLKKKEREKLDEKEIDRLEKEDLLKEKQRIENEIKELNRGRIVDKALIDSSLPIEFLSDRIKGGSESEIQADVKAFKSYIDKLVNELKEKAVNEALAGKAPAGGSSPNSKTITEAQFNAMDPRDRAAFFASGGKISV